MTSENEFHTAAEHLRHLANLLDTLANLERPLDRLGHLSYSLQPAVGMAMRDAVTEAIDHGNTWKMIGEVTGINHTAMWRQYVESDGPILSYWGRPSTQARGRYSKGRTPK